MEAHSLDVSFGTAVGIINVVSVAVFVVPNEVVVGTVMLFVLGVPMEVTVLGSGGVNVFKEVVVWVAVLVSVAVVGGVYVTVDVVESVETVVCVEVLTVVSVSVDNVEVVNVLTEMEGVEAVTVTVVPEAAPSEM